MVGKRGAQVANIAHHAVKVNEKLSVGNVCQRTRLECAEQSAQIVAVFTAAENPRRTVTEIGKRLYTRFRLFQCGNGIRHEIGIFTVNRKHVFRVLQGFFYVCSCRSRSACKQIIEFVFCGFVNVLRLTHNENRPVKHGFLNVARSKSDRVHHSYYTVEIVRGFAHHVFPFVGCEKIGKRLNLCGLNIGRIQKATRSFRPDTSDDVSAGIVHFQDILVFHCVRPVLVYRGDEVGRHTVRGSATVVGRISVVVAGSKHRRTQDHQSDKQRNHAKPYGTPRAISTVFFISRAVKSVTCHYDLLIPYLRLNPYISGIAT